MEGWLVGVIWLLRANAEVIYALLPLLWVKQSRSEQEVDETDLRDSA